MFDQKVTREQIWLHAEYAKFNPFWKKVDHHRWEPQYWPLFLSNLNRELPDILNELLEKEDVFVKCPTLQRIRSNSMLVNRYLNGNAHIPFHKDDHRLFRKSTICSLSLGATRDFIVKIVQFTEEHRRNIEIPDRPEYRFELESGDILLMGGVSAQKETVHSVPPAPECENIRYNLTLRDHNPIQCLDLSS